MDQSKTRDERKVFKKRISKIHFLSVSSMGSMTKLRIIIVHFLATKRYKNVLQRRYHRRARCLVVSLAVIQYVQYHRVTKAVSYTHLTLPTKA